jgi:hypothetical protein
LSKGFNVVSEGQRYSLRVFRRYFYPIPHKIDGEEHVVHSDTGREVEIDYERAEHYGLDDPFSRMALIRLARAMGCLKCDAGEDVVKHCRVTICNSREMNEAEEERWIPFDPKKLEPLDEKLKRLERRVEWQGRLSSTDQ